MFSKHKKTKIFKISRGNFNYIRIVTGKLVDEIEFDYSQISDIDQFQDILENLFDYLGFSEIRISARHNHVEVRNGYELLLAIADINY